MKKKRPEKNKYKNRLAQIIKEKTITKTRLADNTGITRSTLDRLIHNKTRMTVEQMLDLAEYLQIDCRELLEPSQKDLTTLGYTETEQGQMGFV